MPRPRTRSAPKITEETAVARLRRNWRNADGSERSEDQAY
jgi:hypothetical protein